MKGLGYDATSFDGARPESMAASLYHPNVSPLPRAGARGHTHDGSPDHHPYLPYGASSHPESCVLLAPGVVAATLVSLGAGSPVAESRLLEGQNGR
jgi:hypothetical protein